MIVRPSVVLPQPDSPTTPSVSPLADGEVDAVDGANLADRVLEDPGLDREVLDEPLDAEERVRVRRSSDAAAGAVGSSPGSLTTLAPRRRAPSVHAPRRAPRRSGRRERCVAPLADLPQLGDVRPAHAPPLRVRAARVEGAARRRRDHARRLARDRLEPLLLARRAARGCSSARRCTGAAGESKIV